MARLRPLPNPQVPVVDPQTGLMTDDWFRYFFSRDRVGISDLSDVSPTAPANNQVLIYNSSTGKYTPGAN